MGADRLRVVVCQASLRREDDAPRDVSRCESCPSPSVVRTDGRAECARRSAPGSASPMGRTESLRDRRSRFPGELDDAVGVAADKRGTCVNSSPKLRWETTREASRRSGSLDDVPSATFFRLSWPTRATVAAEWSWCVARPAPARALSSILSSSGATAGESRRLSESNLRWSSHTAGCTSCVRPCWITLMTCRHPSATHSARSSG